MLAFSVFLVAGIVVVPVIEEAAAADDKNKGKQGEISSEGKRNGREPGGGNPGPGSWGVV